MSSRASSFYWPMRLLPRAKRQSMFALYGFCRALDDIADGPDSTPLRLAKLTTIRAALQSWRQTGIALHPTVAAIVPAIKAHNLPVDELFLLVDGMESDVNTPLTAPSDEELRLYCRQVAGTVGVMATRIMGRDDADPFAVALAEALQLTNILRDVAEDARRGRLYLPRACLQDAGIFPPLTPLAVLTHPGVEQACRLTAQRAAQGFAQARDELTKIGRRQLWPALAMMAIYDDLLKTLVRRDRWTEPAPRLGQGRKLLLALLALAKAV
ncbi:MAG: phytoene/squalene synthase family protein [Magnetospirillum sp.]